MIYTVYVRLSNKKFMTTIEKQALSMKQAGYQSEDIEGQLQHEFIFNVDDDGNYVSATLWK